MTKSSVRPHPSDVNAPTTFQSTAVGPQASKDDRPRRDQRVEPLLMEIAWEVCHQVGGIYAVLRSKAPSFVSRWGDRYCLIGPYEPHNTQAEFEPAPMVGPIGQVAKKMRQMGFEAHFGRWLVSGRPQVVLLNYADAFRNLNKVKYRLYADHFIPTPGQDELIDKIVAFAEVCRLFLTLLAQAESQRRDLIAHFHEWMAGGAVPMLRQDQWPGAIVFTTHATLLGRYLATQDPLFYDHLPLFDPTAESQHFNVESQHLIERAAAHGAQVFTTVSDVTAEECSKLLNRTPDLLLPNGLNIQRFAALHEFQNLHRQFKERIHEFTIGHFFPSYSFDLDSTLYFFTSGRYEYRNKGIDLTIEALARLNHRLRESGSHITVVCFLITKAPFKSLSVGALESRAMLEEFRTATNAIKEQIGKKLFHSASTGHIPDLNTLVEDYWRLRLRRTILAWKREHLPPIVTHDLIDDSHDLILEKLRQCQLINHAHDPVKVVYHPDFIKATNPLFGMEYDQFVRGCHLGIFPSYYEPWGYTPLESLALGVPAITSDLSGFGSYVLQLLPEHEKKGMYVARRRQRDFNHSAHELTEYLVRYCRLSRRERIGIRNQVESFSEHFDWHNLSRRYHEAHELALDRIR